MRLSLLIGTMVRQHYLQLTPGHGKGKSFALVSDALTHTKESMWVFMNYLLKKLREDNPILEVLDIFSDGAGS